MAPYLFVASQAEGAPEGPRLDQYLVSHQLHPLALGPLSRQAVQRLIASGHVLVDGRQGRRSQRVRAGQRIELTVPELSKSRVLPAPHPLDVLFEDEHLLVLNKPADLPVHPGAGVRRVTLVAALLAHSSGWSGIGGVERPGIVHRLDAGTTGLMVVAKHDLAHRGLAAQFAERRVHKVYLALCAGQLPASWARAGTLDTPYGRHPRYRHRFTGRVAAAKRRAKTAYRVLGEDARASLVECTLHTGRTHQARVHLAELGLPIAGDALYAPSGPAHALGKKLGLTHHALHAARLSFRHPVSEAPCDFAVPPPHAWWQAAQALLPAARLGSL